MLRYNFLGYKNDKFLYNLSKKWILLYMNVI